MRNIVRVGRKGKRNVAVGIGVPPARATEAELTTLDSRVELIQARARVDAPPGHPIR